MPDEMRRFYEFGPFRVDTANRLLMHGGEVVPLKQKAVDTLLVLIERRGEVMEKDALMRRLWPDTFVEESSLSQNVYALRKAFGGAEYIETIPRRGYRFIGDVREWSEDEVIVRERTRASVVIEEEQGVTTRTSRGVVIAAGILVLTLLGFARWRNDPPPPAVIRSIAVLPFRSLSADKRDAYLGVGMADTLITKLSAAGRLVVRPTNAVLKYEDGVRDSLKAGHDLGVDSVLDGSIQRQNDRLRITVRLVRTNDGKPLWASQYDERLTDLLDLQDSISAKVADALSISLANPKRRAVNAEAYRFYLEGRYFWNKRTGDSLKKSIDCFQKAVDADPSYALAYTGLADAYIQLPAYASLSSMEVYPKAKAAAAKALQLDDSLAEAHNSEAGVLSYFEWNWAAAEKEYRKAIALNPNYAAAHHRLGTQLAAMNRASESIAELERARDIDPLSLITNAILGFAYAQAGQHDRAIAQLRKTIELDPNFVPAHELLSAVYRLKGMPERSFVEFFEWRRLSGDDPSTLTGYQRAYATSGLNGVYKQRVAMMLKETHVAPAEVAGLYALLGEKEQSLRWLQTAVEQHEGEVIWIRALHDFDALRSDPRFEDLLRRANLSA